MFRFSPSISGTVANALQTIVQSRNKQTILKNREDKMVIPLAIWMDKKHNWTILCVLKNTKNGGDLFEDLVTDHKKNCIEPLGYENIVFFVNKN